jgi:hypothetical protein
MPNPYEMCLAKAGSCAEETMLTEAAVLTPFVRLILKARGVEITVGNKSAPQNRHNAVISNFEYGATDATIAKITIHDQEGSSFVKFMEDLVKDMKCLPESASAELDFGWIKTNCRDAVGIDNLYQPYHLIVNAIDCHFQDGRIIYDVELTDKMNRHAEGRSATSYGQDGFEGMTITDAIRTLLTDRERPPSVDVVSFKSIQYSTPGSGTTPGVPTLKDIIWKKHDGDPLKGPKGKWETNNLDKLNTVKGWLGGELTQNDKSFILMYIPTTPGGEIRILEDPKQSCNEVGSSNTPCLLKYVVNAGGKSPVISFNPQFRFTWSALASSGGSMGSNNVAANEDGKSTGHDCFSLSRERIPTAGVELTTTATKNSQDRSNGKEPEKDTERAQKQQLLANFTAAIDPSIKADLVIVGNPKLENSFLRGFPLGLVFINPFHLLPDPNSACGEWIAAPLCNEVLTNSRWLIDGISHSITADGKFTTTIKIWLATPGVQLEVGDPFGGKGSGGWVPPAAC